MTLPRSVADVVSRHVLFEIESIDRMYLNLYVPQLQRVEGVLGFIHGHLGQPIASTSAIAPMSRDFTARLDAFADSHGIPRVDFARGQRKDDVMHEYLAAFEAAGRTEGVLFIGRAQEKNTVFRTEKRRAPDGRSYPWIVRTTSVVNQSSPSALSHPARSPSRIFSHVPSSDQRRCRLYAVFQLPYQGGKSRHTVPVRVRWKIPLITVR